MFISDTTIDKVESLMLSDVIKAFIPDLKKNGANYTCRCPFHQDKNASFFVHDAKDIWKCFSCGEGGKSGVYFVMKLQNLNRWDAIKLIAKECGIPLEYQQPERGEDAQVWQKKQSEKQKMIQALEEAAGIFRKNLALSEAETVSAYLQNRFFETVTLNTFGIGYALPYDQFIHKTDFETLLQASLITDKGHPRDFFLDRLMFPLHDFWGNVVGFAGREWKTGKSSCKYLNSRETLVYQKSELLYGYSIARKMTGTSAGKKDCIYLVEGYTNVMRLFENGLPSVATGGTALSEKQVEWITKLSKNVILLRDADKAGQTATYKDIPLFLAKGCSVKVVSLPEKEDVDSLGRLIRQLEANPFTRRIYAYSNLQSYLDTHTYDWLDWTVVGLKDKASPEETAQFLNQLCDTLLLIPEATTQKQWLKEARFYFADILSIFKERKKLLAEAKKDNSGAEEAVCLEPDGSGIKILGYWVANFSLRVVYIIDLKMERKNGKQKYEWVFEIWQKNKARSILYVPSDDFATGQAFHKFLAPLGYSYRGNEEHHKMLIEKLNTHLIRTRDINRIGWSKEAQLFFFSNAAFIPGQSQPLLPDFTATVVHQEKGYRMMHFKEAQESKESPEYREFFFQPSDISLLEVATLIQIAWEDKAILSLCHTISTAFFDVITKVTRCFPIFYAWSAKPSTGKSTLCEFNTAFFGRNRKKSIASENTSIAGLSRVIQNCSNTVVLLDELKRNKSLLAKIDILQQFYDLKGHTITDSRDFDSEFTFEVNTGMFVTANFLPLEPQHKAFRTRLLIYELHPAKSKESYEAYKSLSRLMDGNLSQIMVDILCHRALIEAEFSPIFDELQRKFRDKLLAECDNMEERMFTNAAMLLTPTVILLRNKCIELPVNESDLLGFACEMLSNQYEEETEINPLYNFWLAANEAYLDKKLRPTAHFKLNKDKEGKTTLLKFRFDKFYRQYKDAHKGLGGGELLPDYDLKSQLKRSPAFIDWLSSERFDRDQDDIQDYKQKKGTKSAPKEKSATTSCFLMNYDLLKMEFPLELEMK